MFDIIKQTSIGKFSDAEKCLIFGDTHSNMFKEIIISGINVYNNI